MAGNTTKQHFSTATDLGMDEEALRRSFVAHIEYTQAKDEFSATSWDHYVAAALTLRDRVADRWNKTQQSYYNRDAKRVYYLSLEFLIGRLLEDGLVNLGVRETMAKSLAKFDLTLDEVIDREWDAGLGNGGLGRLAACFIDSMATLGIPAMGCSIRYEYGIFKQLIVNGAQQESPDNWLRYGCPWEIPRPEILFPVKFHGRVETYLDGAGQQRRRWVDTEDVMAMAYDILVPGYRNEVVNTLRLWSAKATREFDLAYFNRGNYIQALHDKAAGEAISRVLYPSDSVEVGKELRLKQEYFFVTATLQDAIRRHLKLHRTVRTLADKAVFQLNDTHPAIAIPELMRLLLDEHLLSWEEAWTIGQRAFAYTNHTVLPEALECWPVRLFERMLPRHLEIIYEINRRFLDEIRAQYPNDPGRVARMSLIDETGERRVRMAHLAIVGSFSVNGVSALHTQILRDRVFVDFASHTPEKFNNKTNGVTPRRWLLKCNPGLAQLITANIGDSWVHDLDQLERLRRLADEPALQRAWQAVKLGNKQRFARFVGEQLGVTLDPRSIFDVQVKRIHEYKRQLLNILHVITLYRRYRAAPPTGVWPRSFIFAGKAAPAYATAKLIIRLINAVADRVNHDPAIRDLIKVVFVPNYGVTVAEHLIPAADLSEQISTAGTEASGTGNMKLALNGALTLGTLDGANVEIRDAVGAESFFLFGLTYAEAARLQQRGYDSRAIYAADAELRTTLDAVRSGELSPDEPDRFAPLVDGLLDGGDRFLVLADFAAYRTAHDRVLQAYADRTAWTRMSILNVAGMGRFSSDQTISAYAREIWHVNGEATT